MCGTSLIVCFSLLLLGVTARPLNDLSIQDTIMTQEGEQHSLDMTSYDLDPSMKIWKKVDKSGPDGEYQLAEGDQAELHHPSLVEVIPLNLSEADATAPDTPVWDVPGEDEEDPRYEVVREYLARLSGNIAGGRPVPEEAMDRWTPVDVMTGSDVMSPSDVRLHSEPEEDFDELYHVDQPDVVQVEVQPPASDIEVQPGDRLHLEPEEDMDDLFHRDQIVPQGPYQGLTRDPDANLRVADEDDL